MRFSCKRGCILAAVLLAAFFASADRLPFAALSAAAQRPASLSGSVVLAAPPIAEHIPLHGVKNFGRVTDHLYRGAQPSAQGFAELKHLGVGIIVNLRDDRDEQEKEERTVETLGLRYVAIPWNARRLPTDTQMADFLDLLRVDPKTKIFVHCQLGADRTGVMIAAYRIADENWTPRQAIAEMKAFHLHFWLPHLNRYIEHFPQRLESLPELRPLVVSP
jgi:tyrosine-protein phosphatase SIW14